MGTPSNVPALVAVEQSCTHSPLLSKRKNVWWFNILKNGILLPFKMWRRCFETKENVLYKDPWVTSNTGQADMTPELTATARELPSRHSLKMSIKASHQHSRPQAACTKRVPRRKWGVRDRPESGCFGLEQNEMVPQRSVLRRRCLIKWV